MTDLEITLSVLRDIRESISTLETKMSSKIDALDGKLDALDERLSGRLDGVETRLGVVEHTLADLASQMLFLGRYVNKLEPKSS